MNAVNIAPVVKVKKHTGRLYALSTDVANYFEREHKHVLDSIDKCLTEQASLMADFSAAKYSIKGRSYKCFEMTRRGFSYLILGFTGKRANQFKLNYIDQFDRMEQHIRDSLDSRSGSLDMCRLLQDTRTAIGKETRAHHFINEHNLVYGVAFGCDAKHLRDNLGLPEDQPITETLTDEQLKEVSDLRHYDAQLLTLGLDYQERKEKLMDLHQCHLRLVKG
jgi:Rha family phage regulatory protein